MGKRRPLLLPQRIIEILYIVLFLMVTTRITAAFFSHFSFSTSGRDIQTYAVNAVYAMREGSVPLVIGYGPVLVAAGAVGLFESLEMCMPGNPNTCGTLVYHLIILFNIIGMFALLLAMIRDKQTRIIALITYAIFLLGVAQSRAIEAGNPDLFLTPLLGAALFLYTSIKKNNRSTLVQMISLGIILGMLIHMKAFLLPFVLVMIVYCPKRISLWVSFFISYFFSALWPWLYGIRSGLFDVFLFATRDNSAIGKYVYTQVNYGNDAILPYVSNILQAFDTGRVSLQLHTFLTNIISICVFILIFIKPWLDEKITFKNLQKQYASFPFSLILLTLAYVIILTLTAWAYDYRILYALPILFIFMGEKCTVHTKQLLYASIVFLLIKCLWIPKDRIMTVFLYFHFYFLLRAAISHWKAKKRNIV
jgi:hypothetical protein